MYRGGTLRIGPLTLPFTWLFIAMSLLIGYGIILVLLRGDRDSRKTISSLLVNALLIFIGLWKIAPLVFQFQAVRQSILLLLYLPGGVPGSIIGLTGAAVYFFLSAKKHAILRRKNILSLGIGAAAALAAGLILNFGLLRPYPPGIPAARLDPAEAAVGHSAGDKLPEFSMSDLEGQRHSSTDYYGKVLFINFWATWCPPCNAEIPEMIRLYRENPPVDYEILAVNLSSTEKNLETIRTYAAKKEMPFPILLDTQNLSGSLFEVSSVPTTLVVGTNGIIVTRKTGAVSAEWMRKQLKYTLP